MTHQTLQDEIELIKDPSFNKTIREVSGLKRFFIDEAGVVEVDLYLKDLNKDSASVKLAVIKLVKIKFQYPGIKINFFQSTYQDKDVKVIQYIGVISGKGGVGKSTVTIQLAYALKSLGYQVGLIDADIYGASLPAILDIDFDTLQQTNDEKIIPLKKDGIELISTSFFMTDEKPLMWRGPMLGNMLSHYFTGVKWDDDTDFILIDLPPGTGDVSLDIQHFVPHTKMIVVTTPHPNASLVAVKAGLGARQIGHEVLGVIENMSYFIAPDTKLTYPIFGIGGGDKVASMLGVEVLGNIPFHYGEAFIDIEGAIHSMYVEIARKIRKKHV
jgi:ATP-binding protein involved in chromosome partitioning